MGLMLTMTLGRLWSRSGETLPTAGKIVDADGELLARVRAGEEAAFVALAARHHTAMLRLARSFVANTHVAEEVVQDTWLVVLRGLEGFEGRSTFRGWLFAILVNRARSTGEREHRSMAVGAGEPAVNGSRFDAAGAWASPPRHWVEESEERMFAQGLAPSIDAALSALPSLQRDVVVLRDIDGLSGQEACEVLEISEANQRVLLHRARSRLRQTLEAEMGEA
jgi:RNA polymerase sigma-70 factor (ECF subfamily)